MFLFLYVDLVAVSIYLHTWVLTIYAHIITYVYRFPSLKPGCSKKVTKDREGFRRGWGLFLDFVL